MKIAYFTPVSPQRTGIADYSEKEILPYLSKYAELDIFLEDTVKPTDAFLKRKFNIYAFSDFEKIKNNYDICVYQMGNSNFHEYIYNTLMKNPGVTVLHDVYLHGFHWSCSIARGDGEKYLAEFIYCYGSQGEDAAKRALSTGAYPEFEYTLIKRIVDHSIGVICHSDFGVKKVLECGTDSIIRKINQPFTVSDELMNIKNINRYELKVNLGMEKKHPIIASFGSICAHKRYPLILRAFKQFLQEYPDSALLLIGADQIGIKNQIKDLGLSQSVIETGYVSENRILDFLAISDFCINLRYPTAGETSRSVLQLMAGAKPVIVSNVGWFCELPNDCCLKVDVDSYEGDTLLEYMRLLAADERLIHVIGRNAQNYVLNKHNPKNLSIEQYRFITDLLNGRSIVLHEVSKELANLGISEDDGEIIRSVSEKIHEYVSNK